jgi:hypothetical protein
MELHYRAGGNVKFIYAQFLKYSLIVSIETPREDVDLYTPIINQVSSSIPIAIPAAQ